MGKIKEINRAHALELRIAELEAALASRKRADVASPIVWCGDFFDEPAGLKLNIGMGRVWLSCLEVAEALCDDEHDHDAIMNRLSRAGVVSVDGVAFASRSNRHLMSLCPELADVEERMGISALPYDHTSLTVCWHSGAWRVFEHEIRARLGYKSWLGDALKWYELGFRKIVKRGLYIHRGHRDGGLIDVAALPRLLKRGTNSNVVSRVVLSKSIIRAAAKWKPTRQHPESTIAPQEYESADASLTSLVFSGSQHKSIDVHLIGTLGYVAGTDLIEWLEYRVDTFEAARSMDSSEVARLVDDGHAHRLPTGQLLFSTQALPGLMPSSRTARRAHRVRLMVDACQAHVRLLKASSERATASDVEARVARLERIIDTLSSTLQESIHV